MPKDSANLGCGCFFCQALPIFLDSLVVAWGAVLISVTLILLFGEVRNFSSLCMLHITHASGWENQKFMFHHDSFISGNNSDHIIRRSRCF